MKLKRLFYMALAVAMVGINIGNGILPVMAAGTDSSVKNQEPVRIPDGDDDPSNDIVLYKTAESVPGYVNKWKVTLKIEAPAVKVTSDTVVVIDRSNSMSGNRLPEAKSAADTLAEQLLPSGNSVNRIAVISYGSDTTTETGFSANYNTVSNAINGITITSSTGGTFTQAGLREAVNLIGTSTATYKNIILLSDGVPTYSYAINNVGAHLQDGGPNIPYYPYSYRDEQETTLIDSASDFDYERRVGDGGVSMPDGYEKWYAYWHRDFDYRYYNHGNSTISEANFYKNSNNGDLYTIAFDAGVSGTEVLNAMASEGKAYTANEGGLEKIFKEIAGHISSLINDAKVADTMGQGVIVSGSGAKKIDWEPKFTLIGDKYVAETSYEVEMEEDVFDQTTTDGFYALNKSAVLTYNDGKTAEFPVPSAKPFTVHVEKELVSKDESGQEKQLPDGQEFRFKVSGVNKTYSVKSGSGNVIRVTAPIKIGTEYTITEDAWVPEGSDIKFENYTVEYTDNVFTITEDHGDQIDVKIKNIYETVNISASKVWDDDNDRDGLRSEYNDLYVVVKDGSNYVAMEKLEAEDKEYEFKELPKNRNGKAIEYKVAEAKGCAKSGKTITCAEDFTGDDKYVATISDGEITNKHDPELYNENGDLTVKKIWKQGTLAVLPGSITVELLAGDEVIQTVDVFAGQNNDWTYTFHDLYKYEDGEEIVYSVREKSILGAEDGTFIVYGNDTVGEQKSVDGKWTSSINGHEITNEWTEATSVYEGESEFFIKKVDENGEVMSGVVFTVSGSDYTTDGDGKIRISVPEAKDVREDELSYTISEKETLEGYDLLEGEATIDVTSESTLSAVDETNLKNTYTKEYTYTKSGNEKFVWNDADKTLVVANNRSLAKSLVIEKTFTGVSESVLKDLTFTVTGPEDFGTNGEITISFSDDCEIDGNKAVCVVPGRITTGDYTVVENNAEIENFTLTVTGDDGKTKTVGKDEEVVFEITNTYEVDKVEYTVVKVWDDSQDKDGKRPATLVIKLYANGELIDTIELSSADVAAEELLPEGMSAEEVWAYIWEGLAKVDENAETIEYTVEEVLESDDYVQTGAAGDEYTTTFVNYHELEPPVDPCDDDEGGCGGGDIPVLVPDTGRFVGNTGDASRSDAQINYIMGGVALVLLGLPVVAFSKRDEE